MRNQAVLEADLAAAAVPVIYLPGAPVQAVTPLDFGHTAELIEVSYQASTEFLAELVAAVAPKPVNVVVHNYDASIADYAALGVRRCSLGGSLAKTVWDAFDAAAQKVKACEP